MLDALAESEWDEYLHDELIRSLPKLGKYLVDPALAAYHETQDADYRFSLSAILAESGVHDDRILEILVAEVRQDPDRAGDLGAYGDEAALPVLHQLLDEFELRQSSDPMANHALIELRGAIERLGGVLTEEQQRKCIAGRNHAEQLLHIPSTASQQGGSVTATPVHDRYVQGTEPLRRAKPKLGRNAPCWCGSGKKYKKCHATADARDT